MKKLIKIIGLLPILLALLLAGCSLEAPEDPTGNLRAAGHEDAMNQYVAIGNSLSAGFMDSGLMKAGQANSFPMIVASQMGITDFTQPWIDFPGIGTTNVGAGNVSGVLYYNGVTVAPVAVTPQAEVAGLLLAVAQPTQYNNMSVPGSFSYDLMSTYSAATSYAAAPPFSTPNSYFEFINRAGDLVTLFPNEEVPLGPGVSTFSGSQFYESVAQGPALVTAWTGGNDFLFGATSGNPSGPASVLITPAAVFAENYGTFLHSLAAGLLNRNGFPATIITATLPFVRNIPYFLDRPSFEAVFGTGYTYEEADAQYILFTDFLASGLTQNPTGTLTTELTLSAAEVTYLDTQVIGPYNAAITTVAGQVNLNPDVPAAAAVVDFNALVDEEKLTNPEAFRHFLYLRVIYGMGPEAEPIADTAARTYFGLDGVHPNNKGYAFVANGFIDVINATLDSDYATVPVDVFVWDPTYGQPMPTKTAEGGIPRISPDVARAMKTSFR